MKVFTYYDYINCIHTLRLNAVMQLAEETHEYIITKKKSQEITKIKEILENTVEVAKFINEFLEPKEKIEEENIIKYKSKYLESKYTKEKISIYKLKTKEIFFLIEEQSTKNNKTIYKMLNYCISIIQEKNKLGNKRNNILIVPIIIYTGDEKWNIKEMKIKNEICDYVINNEDIEFEYNLIEVNKIPLQTLNNKEGKIAKCILEKRIIK